MPTIAEAVRSSRPDPAIYQQRADEWNALQKELANLTGSAPIFKAAGEFGGGRAVENMEALEALKQSVAFAKQKGSVESDYNQRVSDIYKQNEFTAPEYDTEYAQKWIDYLSNIEAPQEQQVLKKTAEQYNVYNPYGLGSGNQIRQSNEMLQNIASDRLARGQNVAQAKYQQDYNQAYTDRTNKLQSALNLLNQQLGRQWSQSDLAQQRQIENDNFLRDQQAAYQMYEATKPKEQAWWQQLLTPIATGAGYALGGGLPGLTASGANSLFSQQTPSYLKPKYVPRGG